MKIDAHYYAVLAFARACGFNKESAYQIAYASQFVDDAKINLMTIEDDPGANVKHDVFNGKHMFLNMATCHSYTRLETFNYDAMINNTCAFHFVPGCKGKNFPEKLRCKEGSDVMNKILNKALEEPDPIKLGIVLHAYADTFSHQEFSGVLSKINDIHNPINVSKLPWDWRDKAYKIGRIILKKNLLDKLLDKGIPAYGHGQAAWYPDLPYLTWSYAYSPPNKFSLTPEDEKKIDNRPRFKEAFKKIKVHLEAFLERYPQFMDSGKPFQRFDVLFDTLIKKNNTRNRIKDWKNLMVKNMLFEKSELFEKGVLFKNDATYDYDENRWLSDAFVNFDKKKFHERRVEDVELGKDFTNSNWYKYYLAVEWYKDEFFDNCSKLGLDIPR